MSGQLLTTKLFSPILRKDVVHRTRLVELINTGLWQVNGFVRKLTLVSAPAGSGKTTLVSEWLQGSKYLAAWLSLDESDNDPSLFLAYLIATLGQLQADFGSGILKILQSPQPPPPQVILTLLVNELSSLRTPFILAIDDYHVIHDSALHQQVAFILDHQPPNMHLMIMTREDPLLPIARLRARGQLLEIRQEDLRFTKDETAEFIRRGTGLALAPDDIAALERHTEGWAAGLQLAALSLHGRDDFSEFISDFTSSSRFILDYLVDEVFARLPAEVKEFLLQTSILNRLTGPLCDDVTGRSGGTELLRSLEQANLFIIPLDASHTWYRYHHLFAELLQQFLRLSGTPEADLHRRASRWYEAHGFYHEAVEHAISAQDWEIAIRVMHQINSGMLKRGEGVTLLGWFKRIPAAVTRSNPGLCLMNAWAAMLTSQFDIAAPLLAHAEQAAEPGSHFLGQVASAQAFLARAQRDSARAIQKSEQALALLPETDLETRGNIAFNLGLAYWHEGRMVEAEGVLVQAQDLTGRTGNIFALLTVQIFLARIAAVRGKLHQAAGALTKLVQTYGQIPILCLAHFDLATLYHEWNELPAAAQHLEQGAALSVRSGNLEFRQSGCLLRAILAHAQRDDEGALAALSEADALAQDFPAAVRSRTAAFGVQLALMQKDRQMLSHWSAKVAAEVDAHSFYRFMGLTRARLLIDLGQKKQAAGELKALHQTASSAGWGYGLVAIRILQCLAAETPNEAVQFMGDALRLGEAEGMVRSFVDASGAIIPALQDAARAGISPGYVGLILSAMGAEGRKAAPEQASLVEPLSERELEVLRLVTAGLSNREIALKLVITPGTAKTHIHNLCGKLGVKNRTEAAARARELGLV
jgi:LuxR family transcriptional regulator, maltose regulon positive regulatory protein